MSKRYLLRDGQPLLASALRDRLRGRKPRELWALRNIDLRVEAGETLGIIGRNGAGKTTLLRLLAGVSGPTQGRVLVRGRMAPLIGVGVGFNPELTGRENVAINGQLLGLSARQVRQRYDEIVDFSEIEQFLDTPVKYYSSGMYLRLAFAVAIHTDPDVLVVDEVLAVGDLSFQVKCNERMREIQRQGATVIVVTHSLELLARLTERAVLIHKGELVVDGTVDDAITAYQRVLQRDQEVESVAAGGPSLSSAISVTPCRADGTPTRHFRTGDRARFSIVAEFHRHIDDPIVMVQILRESGEVLFAVHTPEGAYGQSHGPGRPLAASVDIDVRMLSGSWAVRAVLFRAGEPVLAESSSVPFQTTSETGGILGLVDLSPSMQLDGHDIALPVVRATV